MSPHGECFAYRNTDQHEDDAAIDPKHCIRVRLLKPLELVASLALADCAAQVQNNIRTLQHLASHPSHLSLLMLPPRGSQVPAGSAFMLSNQSGLAVTAWLTQTSQAGMTLQSSGKHSCWRIYILTGKIRICFTQSLLLRDAEFCEGMNVRHDCRHGDSSRSCCGPACHHRGCYSLAWVVCAHADS